MTTDAKTGASGGEVAVAPAVAHRASQRHDAGVPRDRPPRSASPARRPSGAPQLASAITSARGDTEGGDASIGIALALTIANHTVEAWTAPRHHRRRLRPITASTTSDTPPRRRSPRRPARPRRTTTAEHRSTSVDRPDRRRARLRRPARQQRRRRRRRRGRRRHPPRRARVACPSRRRSAINIHRSISRAYIVGATRSPQRGGAFSLTSAADTDAGATRDGAAVTAEGGDASIGVGVAINYVKVINTADRPVDGRRSARTA